ncbi:UDP-N-acetylglucosamine 4,6-dehydratase family protein [Cohnella cholangitidis]|uniref:Polysaccharide biosynthesis protein n=1 Tax=Cohnella cholangitidis TaxID=2598458 RepID=A0A7G5BXI8_9BACL|nr:UDP-N-acetylglucosamine 4,6-dehydratase family protein [Cohnella cholangitidis]QMV41672.1 polysaccharide biosynthesis protein [Cohnella cholangitidis]
MGIYTDKKVLIVGGTGTIGYHLTKRLLQENPKVIRIFSRDEYKQYEMGLEFQEHADKLRFLIGDVRDQQRLARAMEDIDYVFHLAAMKHVPFCEYNPFEAVQTNVIGTQNVIQSAIQAGVKKVLFTSTDKAVSPSNTYGATKLTAERLISAAGYQKGSKVTSFASVRFGNVMGSRGSVIPLFKKQILEQRKVTITDMRMTRYMMTPQQAISLLMEANGISKGGEVFVLKMPVVRLADLTAVMIEQLSKDTSYHGDVEVKEIGLRPGEKLDEELMTMDEQNNVIETDFMYIIPPIYGHSISKNSYVTESWLSDKMKYSSNELISKAKLLEWLKYENLI